MIRPTLKAIRAVLVASTAITNTVSQRVYSSHVPEGAILPYGVLSSASTAPTNDTPRDALDATITVNWVGEDADTVQVLQASTRTLLHEVDLTMEGGWLPYRCQQTTEEFYSELEERKPIYYAPSNYRIRATK